MQASTQVTVRDIQALVQGYSLELTPKAVQQIGPLRSWLPSETKIFVTFLPGTTLANTLDAAIAIQQQGYEAVPHIAVRNVESPEELRAGIARIKQAGIKEVLLIAGGEPKMHGGFNSTLEVLAEDFFADSGVERFAFAGHPEGHPVASEETLWQALQVKQAFVDQHPVSGYLMTQFCFTAQPLIDWTDRLEQQKITLPVRVGVPGVASVSALIKHARACGVGASINFLLNNTRNITRLMRLSTPDTLLLGLAQAKAQGHLARVNGLHLFPLGGFEKTITWVNAVGQGLIRLN